MEVHSNIDRPVLSSIRIMSIGASDVPYAEYAPDNKVYWSSVSWECYDEHFRGVNWGTSGLTYGG